MSDTKTEVAKVESFYDEDGSCEMELVSMSATGLCKCIYRGASDMGEVRVARHRDRVRPLNNAAKAILGYDRLN